MAQLYKMTVYVCDLEENLSLDEIKTLIDEHALSGVAVNAICRFANEQTGKRIEWYDDVDINKLDCPVSAWEKYFDSSYGERMEAPQTPCDLCKYNPPSSCDGKPCSVCPASAVYRDGEAEP